MIVCQILYVSDNKDDKYDKDKFDKEKVEIVEKVEKVEKVELVEKVEIYSANKLGEKLKHVGFDVGEAHEDVGFDETLKIVYEKMFSVSEVTFVL